MLKNKVEILIKQLPLDASKILMRTEVMKIN